MQPLLPLALPDFSQASILVIGDVMLDRYWFGETSRISPEAPVPVVNIQTTSNRPGGASNVALNIAALGAKVTLIGVTGKDEAADILREQLSAAGVNHDFHQVDGLATIIKLRVMSHHQQLIRLDFEEKSLSHHQDQLFERYQKHLENVDLIILSDYQKGTLSHPQQLIQLARERNIPVLVDPKGSDFTRYTRANIITPNFKEFEAVVGTCHSEQAILDKGRDLLRKHHIATLLITRGEHGMTLINDDKAVHLPAFAREVFDVTGAGDTVIAVLGASVALGIDLLEAAALANLAASLTITKLGAATLSPPELQAALTGKTNFMTGIVNDEQLLQAINQLRGQGKKIAFTNGCFDILHAGHVTLLQMAKQLADYLIVAINTDDSIHQIKGPHRPINHLEHRMTVLAGLGVVDWVIPFAESSPERLLQLLQPDILVKGPDYRVDQVVGADIVHAYGGEVRIVNPCIPTSTTAIIHRIHERAANEIK